MTPDKYRERAAEAVAPYFVEVGNSYVADARYRPLVDAIADLCAQVAEESAPRGHEAEKLVVEKLGVDLCLSDPLVHTVCLQIRRGMDPITALCEGLRIAASQKAALMAEIERLQKNEPTRSITLPHPPQE